MAPPIKPDAASAPEPCVLVLICGDHEMYFDAAGRCVLHDLPFAVEVFASRASAEALAACDPALLVRRLAWSDFERVRGAARELAARRPLRAVSTANEGLMELAAELRQLFGLGGLWPDAAAPFRDKLLMKQRLQAHGVRVPQYARCDDQAAARALLARHGKVVIKPVDGFGSRDVAVIDTQEALAAWYAGADPEQAHRYEIEEFIEGGMYHVNAVVSAGVPLLSASAAYVPGMASIDYARGEPLVSVSVDDAALRQRLDEFSARVIALLGLRDGVTHLECFLGADGALVLCEIAARPAGGGIVYLIEHQYGIHLGRAQLLLEGGRADLIAASIAGAPPRDDRVVGLIGFRVARSGVVARICDRQAYAERWISHVSVYAAPGGFIKAARQSSNFLCLLVFEARDHSHFHARRRRLQRRFASGLAYAGPAAAQPIDQRGAP